MFPTVARRRDHRYVRIWWTFLLVAAILSALPEVVAVAVGATAAVYLVAFTFYRAWARRHP